MYTYLHIADLDMHMMAELDLKLEEFLEKERPCPMCAFAYVLPTYGIKSNPDSLGELEEEAEMVDHPIQTKEELTQLIRVRTSC